MPYVPYLVIIWPDFSFKSFLINLFPFTKHLSLFFPKFPPFLSVSLTVRWAVLGTEFHMGLSPSHVGTGSTPLPHTGMFCTDSVKLWWGFGGWVLLVCLFGIFSVFVWFYFCICILLYKLMSNILLRSTFKNLCYFFLRFLSSCWMHIYLPWMYDQTHTGPSPLPDLLEFPPFSLIFASVYRPKV